MNEVIFLFKAISDRGNPGIWERMRPPGYLVGMNSIGDGPTFSGAVEWRSLVDKWPIRKWFREILEPGNQHGRLSGGCVCVSSCNNIRWIANSRTGEWEGAEGNTVRAKKKWKWKKKTPKRNSLSGRLFSSFSFVSPAMNAPGSRCKQSQMETRNARGRLLLEKRNIFRISVTMRRRRRRRLFSLRVCVFFVALPSSQVRLNEHRVAGVQQRLGFVIRPVSTSCCYMGFQLFSLELNWGLCRLDWDSARFLLLFFSVVPSSRIRPIFLRDRLESFFFFVRTWKCAFFSNFYDRQPCPSYFPSVYGTESVLLCTFDNIEKSFSETFRSRRIRIGSICLARVSAIFSPVIKCLWTLVYFSCYYYLIIYECRQLL